MIHPHPYHSEGQFPGEPELAGCPTTSPVPNLCIMPAHGKTFDIFFNMIQASLPRISPLYCSIDLDCYTSLICLNQHHFFMFTMSKPPQSTRLYHQNPFQIIILAVRFLFLSFDMNPPTVIKTEIQKYHINITINITDSITSIFQNQ